MKESRAKYITNVQKRIVHLTADESYINTKNLKKDLQYGYTIHDTTI